MIYTNRPNFARCGGWKMCGDNRANINDNVSALADLGDVTESNTTDSESALAELADMVASIDERITALEAKGE